MQEDDAIRLLNAAGFSTTFRDWSLGRSIFVGIEPTVTSGITVYSHAKHIYRQEGAWFVTSNGREHDVSFPSLEDAVEHTMVALRCEARVK